MAKNKSYGIGWLVGLCSFLAVMCAGICWLLGICGINGGLVSKIGNIAQLVILLCVLVSGWFWLSDWKINKTAKLVVTVFFILFTVLAICGVFGIGL